MCVKLSQEGYVRGYDVETISSKILDVDKPRDTNKVSSVSIPFEMGNLLRVFDVEGTPKFRETVNLKARINGLGTTIGEERYSFNLTDGTYANDSTQFDLYLYDIQTYTEITFNQQLATSQLPAGSHIRGKSSGATAFAVNAGASGLTVMFRQTSGTFAPGEQIEINGVDDLPVSNFQAGPRTIVSTRVFNSRDIMSVTQTGVSGF